MKLTEVRSSIIKRISPILVQNGYKMIARGTEPKFKKETAFGFCKFNFFFDSYLPLYIKVYSIFSIYQSNVAEVIRDFYFKTSRKFWDGVANMSFLEADLNPEFWSKPIKYKVAFKNVIKDEADVEKVIDKYCKEIEGAWSAIEKECGSAETTFHFLDKIKDQLGEDNMLIETYMYCAFKVEGVNKMISIKDFFVDRLTAALTENDLIGKRLIEEIQEFSEYLIVYGRKAE